jgi:hypothetical protein
MKNFFLKFTRRFQHFVCVRSPISILTEVPLSKELVLDVKKVIPRGKSFDGKYFSWMHDISYTDLPTELLELIMNYWPRIQKSMGGRAILRPATIYRTTHIPQQYEGSEAFAEAWHRDTTGIPNIQLFVLLQDTDLSEGPLQYISSEHLKEVSYLVPELKNKKLRSKNMKVPAELVSNFTGLRGRALLLNTYSNFHKASVPHIGRHRDMISIAFEPVALTEWDKSLTTSRRQLKKILKNRKAGVQ